MPKSLSPASLYRIEECPHLMADGCICDERSQLVFLSLWGRDTAVQELLARLTLGGQEDGLDQLHLQAPEGTDLAVYVGDAQKLDKRTTRAFRRTLFGSMIHLWLFDKRCIAPDKANASALAILPKESSMQPQRLWTLVRDTCPLPLLDHWSDVVLDLLQSRAMLTPLPFALGPLQGYQLSMDVGTLSAALGELIRTGRLDTSPLERVSDTPLRRVA
jgi:hypothetical protein